MAVSTAPTPIASTTLVLRTNPRRRRSDAVARWLFRIAALSTFVITLLIIGILLVDAVEYLTKLADTDDGLGSLFDIGWFPRRGIFDIGTLVVGTLIVTEHRDVDRGAARHRCRHLPRGVRAARVFVGSASRSSKCWPESRASSLGYFAIAFINPELVVNLFSGAEPGVHLARRRHRRRNPDHPDHRLGRRGFAAGRADGAARGVVRARRAAPPDELPCRRSRRRSRASSPRSSSACRERSARRWWLPSPPALSVEVCSA